jgi:hypothetical protein
VRMAGIDAIPREQLRGQSALVRIDAADDSRLRDSLATLNFLSESGARTVIATHSGSPARNLESIRTQLIELLGREVESERIFARANSILASHGFISADQMAAQGEPAEMILRRAGQLEAGLIVLAAGVAKETNGIRRVTERATCEVLVAPSTVAVRVARTPHA